MHRQLPAYKIITVNDLFIIIIDNDDGPTITNRPNLVIKHLNEQIDTGIGCRRVYYRDTMGRYDELKVKDGRFLDYAPCTATQQTELAKHIS